MPLGDPTPTSYDVNFRVLGFPVRVHPLFWVVALLLSQGATGGLPVLVLIWVVVMFVSILVHELGHAVLQQWFGGRPRIVLYGMGGLAISQGPPVSAWRQVAIALAGPLAGFLLAGVVWLAGA
ncbi:MAG: M50 family metallopeptidase, partial [Planctomycetota bacterium]